VSVVAHMHRGVIYCYAILGVATRNKLIVSIGRIGWVLSG